MLHFGWNRISGYDSYRGVMSSNCSQILMDSKNEKSQFSLHLSGSLISNPSKPGFEPGQTGFEPGSQLPHKSNGKSCLQSPVRLGVRNHADHDIAHSHHGTAVQSSVGSHPVRDWSVGWVGGTSTMRYCWYQRHHSSVEL